MLESYLFGIENTEGVVTKIGVIEQAHKGTLYIDEIWPLAESIDIIKSKLDIRLISFSNPPNSYGSGFPKSSKACILVLCY